MPKYKQVPWLVTLATEATASMAHKAAVHLDSISWPSSPHPTFPEAIVKGSWQTSPNLSPLNPQHAAVILSPSFDGLEPSTSFPTEPASSTSSSSLSSPSVFSQNYVDFCKQLQSWFRQLPVHLLELVISKVLSLNRHFCLICTHILPELKPTYKWCRKLCI